MIAELQRKNFDPDPVKKWKAQQAKAEQNPDLAALDNSDSDSDLEEDAKDADYDYLMGMAMWNLTLEKKEELLKKKEEKHKELAKLKGTTKEQLWLADLDELIEKLDEVEQKEREDAAAGITSGGSKMKKGKKALKEEAMPSPHGIRIQPKIPAELRTKAAKAAAAKDKKSQKAVAKKLDPGIFTNFLEAHFFLF